MSIQKQGSELFNITFIIKQICFKLIYASFLHVSHLLTFLANTQEILLGGQYLSFNTKLHVRTIYDLAVLEVSETQHNI